MQNQSLSPSRILEGLLFLLFVVSPFYITSSIGGTGFDLPFNISVWFAATLVIGFMLWHVAGSNTITLPKNYIYLLMLPAGILLSAVIAGVVEPVTWLFRILYILAGVIFLFGLFQFKSLSVERVLFFIVLSGLLVSIYGIVQIHQWQSYTGSFLQSSKNLSPTTIFQQVNVTASYLATSILIAIYLLFTSSVNVKKTIQSILYITVVLSTYVVVSSGSRVGLLSLALGLIFLFIGLSQSIKKDKVKFSVVILMLLLSSWAGQAGLNKTTDKAYELVNAENSEARVVIYRAALGSIQSSPLVGHGIGSYKKEWLAHSPDWYEYYSTVDMPYTLEHPHNELLMWAIEGGVLAVIGILIALISTVWCIARFYGLTSLAYFSLLLPISMHTMLELPFYISSLHWFVWLFLIFVALKNIVVDKNNQLSRMAGLFIRGITLILGVVSLLFLLQTGIAQKDITDYVYGHSTDKPLQLALINPYFQGDARTMANRSVLYHAIKNGNHQKIIQMIDQLQLQLDADPDLKLFEDVINGFESIENKHKSCSVAEEALKNYPWNGGLKKYLLTCH
ncbi:Wzy polymerase domain-containing protein [Methylophaga sulfidovorans]|uniref:Virulence factor membrane-bound polymerase, C-terminal n=1 Tax=Methylophaga sulfidovorans TaxID=45496 RepID=A0A1I4BT08_9GAMM|nr:Wzy polymerase domain-containing protein [Methylophaga sulfidovorans]SFK71673.1 Virulence factor membrane-bound polymerase, C-terminal [Methylophaga sulfidovorans]